MFRKLFVLALVIIALHVAAVLTLGTSPAGSLIGNLLQIASSGLAVAAGFCAPPPATGFSRRLLVLVGRAAAVLGGAKVGWACDEICTDCESSHGRHAGSAFRT